MNSEVTFKFPEFFTEGTSMSIHYGDSEYIVEYTIPGPQLLVILTNTIFSFFASVLITFFIFYPPLRDDYLIVLLLCSFALSGYIYFLFWYNVTHYLGHNWHTLELSQKGEKICDLKSHSNYFLFRFLYPEQFIITFHGQPDKTSQSIIHMERNSGKLKDEKGEVLYSYFLTTRNLASIVSGNRDQSDTNRPVPYTLEKLDDTNAIGRFSGEKSQVHPLIYIALSVLVIYDKWTYHSPDT